MLSKKILTACVFLTAGFANAHLVDKSLTPVGGATVTLNVGDLVTIAWKVEEIHHKSIQLDFSKDNGKTWTKIEGDLPDESTSGTYKWTVKADFISPKGKLRVCQNGPCADKDSVSKAGGSSSPWYLVNGPFKIQTATAVNGAAAIANDLTMDFNPDTRNIDVAFAMDKGDAVLLQAFDSNGRLVATLIDGKYAAGEHKLSLFSNRLTAASGSLFFKLKAGDKVRTHAWMALR